MSAFVIIVQRIILYFQRDKSFVVIALLDWLVSGEEVPALMDGFLQNFMLKHSLDCDATLALFVTETLAASSKDWWAWQEAPWEDKLYAVIQVISNSNVSFNSLMKFYLFN